MTQTGPDAEADEKVTLIRSIRAGVLREKEAVKDGDEGSGLIRGGLDDLLNVGVGADGAAEDRVARGDGRAISSKDCIRFRLEGGQSWVAKEADCGAEELCCSRAAGWIG